MVGDDLKSYVYHKELNAKRRLSSQRSGGADDWVVSQVQQAGGAKREFVASRSGQTRPMWVDKLFAAEIKQRKQAALLGSASDGSSKDALAMKLFPEEPLAAVAPPAQPQMPAATAEAGAGNVAARAAAAAPAPAGAHN